MVIKFHCPNGHSLSTTEGRAGKPGKCPKCGAAFTVPTLAEAAALAGAAVSGGAGSAPATHLTGSGEFSAGELGAGSAPTTEPGDAAAKESTSSKSNGEAHAPTEGAAATKSGVSPVAAVHPAKPDAAKSSAPVPAETIVFLCPNGHKLNGPKSLQGKPGQCPHCGERFRIPVYDAPLESATQESPPTEEEGAFPAFGAGGSAEAPLETAEYVDPETIEEIEEVADAVPEAEPQQYDYEANMELPPDPAYAAPQLTHPLGIIVAHLWADRGGGVELKLRSGETLLPQYFSPALSQAEYGVFGLANDDGTYNLAILPWNDIARAVLTELKQLPPGLFE